MKFGCDDSTRDIGVSNPRCSSLTTIKFFDTKMSTIKVLELEDESPQATLLHLGLTILDDYIDDPHF